MRSRRRRESARSLRSLRCSSPRRTVPCVGRSSPAAICSSVDFPEPDGPMIAVNVPAASDSVTPSSARTWPSPRPKTRTTSSMWTMAERSAGSGRLGCTARLLMEAPWWGPSSVGHERRGRSGRWWSSAWAFVMRTPRSPSERMATMRRSLDLLLTAMGVGLGVLTLALQRAADDAVWRDVDALALVLVLLMALPAATCRRAPTASAVTALTAALAAAALGYPPTSGWFSALLIAAAAVFLTDRRHAAALATYTLIGDVLASIAAADATGEPLSAFQLVANVCVIGVPLLLADLLREQRRLLAKVRDQSGRLAQLSAAEAGEAAARERVRIAREVHDVVGNELSAIAVQAGAGQTLVGADPDEARATFRRIAEMAREALT